MAQGTSIRRRRRKPEDFPWVAVLGWPLVIVVPFLVYFLRTHHEGTDALLRVVYGVPGLVAMLWAFSKVNFVRRYRKYVLAVLIAGGLEFLGLFLWLFAIIWQQGQMSTTQPADRHPPTTQSAPPAK